MSRVTLVALAAGFLGCAPAGSEPKCAGSSVKNGPPCQCAPQADAGSAESATGWAKSSDSASRADQTRKPNSCFASDGCPFPPYPVPRCPAGAGAQDDWWDLGREGTRVVASGRLETMFGETTQAGCSVVRPCCNTERARLVVRTTRGRIGLASTDNPYAFVCVGDQSADCCPFPPDASVLVSGVIASRFAWVNYEITNPELCILTETRTD